MLGFTFITAVVLTTVTNLEGLQIKQQNRQSNPKVIVVGGGVAGLKGASLLHNAGFNVILFEAMDRIGGRTHTLKLGSGHHIELGGEWVHGEKNNSIFDLVSPLGLLQPNPKEFDTQFGLPTGEVLNKTLSDQITKLLEYMWEDPENWGEELEVEVSMGDFSRFIFKKFNEVYPIHSDPKFLEAVFDWCHRITNSDNAADDWYHLSASDEGEQYVTIDGHDVPWLPPYSYHSLHQLILTGNVTEDGVFELPEWIKLNTPVTKIKYSTQSESVTVTTADGNQHTADHVLFTPSLGVLKATHSQMFSPALSARKRLAIENIGFGSVTKLAFEFDSPWWPEGFEGLCPLWNDHENNNHTLEYWRNDITKEELMTEYDGIPLWCRGILTFFTVDSGSAPNILRVWMTGMVSRFLDEMDPVYIQTHVMKLMHKFLYTQFPNITEPIRSYQSKWWSNPYTRGVYSYRSMESDRLDVWARDLAQPILHSLQKPLICFAGEATHHAYFSTVHGAYETGLREFHRIQSFYDAKTKSSSSKLQLSVLLICFKLVCSFLHFMGFV